MPTPRIFISSTFYDLKHVRDDLERFIRDLGYEPVRNETGSVSYGKDSPESYAYREVELSDMIVSIVGGRFGTESSQNQAHSISMEELEVALKRDVQVFIFIEKNVFAEYSTYQINKENDSVKYRFVDDLRVYEFIEGLHKLPRNNPIATFETSNDIVVYLRSQWAGMFQRFLNESMRMAEYRILEEMNSVAQTLRELVDFLTKERKNKDQAIQGILLANHPAFRVFADFTKTNYRVFFTNRKELNAWLRTRGWRAVDTALLEDDEFAVWAKPDNGRLTLKHNIFDKDGKLKVFTEDEWRPRWLIFEPLAPKREIVDDIPF